MIEYLNHIFDNFRNPNFVYVDSGPARWLYCIKCNIGCWYEPFCKNEFNLHMPRLKNNKISHFGPSLNENEYLTCEEMQIKNLLE